MFISLTKNFSSNPNINSNFRDLHIGKVSHSFIFPFILANMEVGELDSKLALYSYSVLMFSLVAFCCFINIVLYGLGYYLAQNSKYNDVNKYPFLSKILKRYTKVTTITISI